MVNQYVYRVFNGDYSRPLFHNYLDGSDGWHRVGYHGAAFGYPPSPYCDMHNPNQPCMTPGQIMGWGLLAFSSPDLAALEQALVRLALDGNRKPGGSGTGTTSMGLLTRCWAPRANRLMGPRFTS